MSWETLARRYPQAVLALSRHWDPARLKGHGAPEPDLEARLASIEAGEKTLNPIALMDTIDLEIPHSNILAAFLSPTSPLSPSLASQLVAHVARAGRSKPTINSTPPRRGAHVEHVGREVSLLKRRADLIVRLHLPDGSAHILIENKWGSQASAGQPRDLSEAADRLYPRLLGRLWLSLDRESHLGWTSLSYADLGRMIEESLKDSTLTEAYRAHLQLAKDYASFLAHRHRLLGEWKDEQLDALLWALKNIQKEATLDAARILGYDGTWSDGYGGYFPLIKAKTRTFAWIGAPRDSIVLGVDGVQEDDQKTLSAVGFWSLSKGQSLFTLLHPSEWLANPATREARLTERVQAFNVTARAVYEKIALKA